VTCQGFSGRRNSTWHVLVQGSGFVLHRAVRTALDPEESPAVSRISLAHEAAAEDRALPAVTHAILASY